MDNRTKPRKLTHKPVTINGAIKAHCFDINDEGMYIQTEAEFKSNDIITLDFILEDRNISAKASVRHLEPGFGFGTKFLEMKPVDKALLRRFLSSETIMESDVKIALLIDGNERSRSTYKHRLLQDRISVMEAPNGNEAFKILQLTKPDVVVLDIQIEGISAFKILQFMRTKPDLLKVPTVILTSRFIPEEVDKVHALGVKDYLAKAMTTPNILSEKIKQLLKD